eukprot:GHVT01104527.1.p2 GENE.GHVT01104527.1~~GHVT01104527.1.p2  ORF type:complete len:318 (+),score=8.54 GHVT01104527.1:3605-4558(+)
MGIFANMTERCDKLSGSKSSEYAAPMSWSDSDSRLNCIANTTAQSSHADLPRYFRNSLLSPRLFCAIHNTFSTHMTVMNMISQCDQLLPIRVGKPLVADFCRFHVAKALSGNDSSSSADVNVSSNDITLGEKLLRCDGYAKIWRAVDTVLEAEHGEPTFLVSNQMNFQCLGRQQEWKFNRSTEDESTVEVEVGGTVQSCGISSEVENPPATCTRGSISTRTDGTANEALPLQKISDTAMTYRCVGQFWFLSGRMQASRCTGVQITTEYHNPESQDNDLSTDEYDETNNAPAHLLSSDGLKKAWRGLGLNSREGWKEL